MEGTNWIFPTASWRTNAPLDTELDEAFELWTGCDDEPPTVVAVSAFCEAGLIRVTFSEEVGPETASDNFNYLIFDTNGVPFDATPSPRPPL